VFNPASNRRPSSVLEPTTAPKKVLVVGAGPGGLEAALVAAQRGHSVVLCEQAPASQAGGQFLIAAYPPFKQDLTRAIRYLVHTCRKNGVEMRFDTKVDEALIKAESPDVLIVATGSTPIQPSIPGAEGRVVQANDVLVGKAVVGQSALVIGGGLVGVETAEYCVEYAGRVAVVEMLDSIAPDLYMTVRDRLINRFRQNRVEVYTSTKVLEVTDDGAICDKGGEQLVLSGFDTIIAALGSKAYQPFADLDSLAPEVYVIGDAKQARSVLEAIYEGFRVAQAI
jgi:NADPH-dependent 2,4-dienoyl-CoA reductase/sulfur reductase-like enzyme